MSQQARPKLMVIRDLPKRPPQVDSAGMDTFKPIGGIVAKIVKQIKEARVR